jgi:hypothetical protein
VYCLCRCVCNRDVCDKNCNDIVVLCRCMFVRIVRKDASVAKILATKYRIDINYYVR